MGYIGNDLQVAYPNYTNIDDISGSFNGVTTSFALTVGGVAPVPAPRGSNQCMISVGGVIQRPDDTGAEGFRLSGGNIVFSSAPNTGEDFFGVILAGADYVNVGANFPSGTAAVPSITFDSDLDTGILNPAANELAFTTGGTQRLSISSAGQLSNNLGTAGAPSYTFTGDVNTGIYSPGADQVAISTNGTGRLFINSSGSVGIGSSTPDQRLVAAGGIASTGAGNFGAGNAAGAYLSYEAGGDARLFARSVGAASYLSFWTSTTGGSSEKVRITDTGSVGIGTTSPGAALDCRGTNGASVYIGGTSNAGSGSEPGTVDFRRPNASGNDRTWGQIKSIVNTATQGSESSNLVFQIQNAGNLQEAVRIDGSSRLLVGTSSTSEGSRAVFQGWSGDSAGSAILKFALGSATPAADQYLAYFDFTDSGHLPGARFGAQRDGGTWSASSKPSRLVFSTTADGASSPTEQFRVDNKGTVMFGTTDELPVDINTTGITFYRRLGLATFSRSGGVVQVINRKADDGLLVDFRQDSVSEGNISVSGTTISYNGAHLSRWSQLPSGAERTEILRGSVLSNIDEMCEWGEEENEQLNRMKVSDVEGDKNVAGVFQAWDDDDDTYTNDFYCAMTGDFIIRIAAGTTVERGDLLMSAGDGTAKPQDDDIIRSKTIAKVTSTNVSCTYDDGSYCVPCVLMAC